MRLGHMRLWMFIGILVSAQAFAGGHKEGNGGDAVYCRQEPGATFSGLYALDYIVAKIYNPAGIREFSNYAEAMKSVKNRMGWFAPELANKLSEFQQIFQDQVVMKSSARRTAPFYWRRTDATLINIEDEGLYSDLPENCRDPKTGEPNLRQAVARVERKGQILFHYHAPTLEELSKNGDQLSWIILHEFLWKYFSNSATLKEANEYFHSEEFQTNSPREIRTYLDAVGFFDDFRPFTRVDLDRFREIIQVGDLFDYFPTMELVSGGESSPMSDYLRMLKSQTSLLQEGVSVDPVAIKSGLEFFWKGVSQGTDFETMKTIVDGETYVFPDISEAEWISMKKFYEHWVFRVGYAVEIYTEILPVVARAANVLKIEVRETPQTQAGGLTCEDVGLARHRLAEIFSRYPAGLGSGDYSQDKFTRWFGWLDMFLKSRGCMIQGETRRINR